MPGTHAARMKDQEQTRALDSYMQQMRRHPVLSLAEQTRLTRRYAATGDPAAARRLALGNLRLVAKIAFGYGRNRVEVLDLIQEGNLGLLRAIERFDPRRGVRLTTFAAWWIRAYQLRHLLQDRCLVKLGTNQQDRRLFFSLGRIERELARSGQTVTEELLAERLRDTPSQLAELRGRLTGELPLHAPASPGVGGRPLQDLLPGDDGARPDVQAEGREHDVALRRVLRAFGETLQGRERALFQDRLLAEEPITLSELGLRFGISRERTRQIERSLLERLRAHLQREMTGPLPALAA